MLPNVKEKNEVVEFGKVSVEAKDLIVPTARILQKMSKALDTNPEFRAGEIRDSLSGELLGDESEPLSVVVFLTGKQWIIRENCEGGKFLRYEPYTQENCDRRWEFEEDGVQLKAVEVYNFTCLNVKDKTFPIVFPMSSMAVKYAAKKLMTIFSKLAAQGKPIHSLVLDIRTQKLTDKGIYWVPSVSVSKEKPSDSVIESAHFWWSKLRSANVVVDSEEKHDDDEIPF